MSTAKTDLSSESHNPETAASKFPPASCNSGLRPSISPTTDTEEQVCRRASVVSVRVDKNDIQQQNDFALRLNHEGERLLNAREVAARLGVSERWVRDHTTRRFPKIRGIKLGTLIRYRKTDLEFFVQELGTLTPSRRSRIGV